MGKPKERGQSCLRNREGYLICQSLLSRDRSKQGCYLALPSARLLNEGSPLYKKTPFHACFYSLLHISCFSILIKDRRSSLIESIIHAEEKNGLGYF